MSRLIVLSNRVKLPDDKQAGGLAIAVANALREQGGVWLGWNGEVVLEAEHESPPVSQAISQTQDNVTYITLPLSQAQYQHFYCGFANSVLWAFLHDRDDLINEHHADFDIYQQVNAQFARQLSQIAEPDDVIWVHDYHFLSVAHYCRKLGMSNRIGFFLHIPFAASERWQHCPHAETLLAHVSDYDVVGVQTQADKSHCQAVLSPFVINKNTIIDHYPIGVDVKSIRQHRQANIQSQQASAPLANDLNKLIKIIAVDRVDYSKGILRRLQVFAQVLQTYPEYHGKIQLQQIACPSRLDLPAYRELYHAVGEQVKHIQNQFATSEWQPIIYSEAVLAHAALMQEFFESDICWVNSLKDGMNLVAKEYIAAQHPEHAGVLLLSQHAGASEQMQQAILIDPYDEQNVLAGLLTAIRMPFEEKQRRYHALMQGLTEQDLFTWQQRFLQDLYAKAL